MQLRFCESPGEFVTTIPFNAPFTLQKGVGAVALSVSPNGLPAPPAGEPRGVSANSPKYFPNGILRTAKPHRHAARGPPPLSGEVGSSKKLHKENSHVFNHRFD